ncbi:hypothetical protein MMG00_02395 [Ignatzschineria rhizosphaerae]|uniref:Phage tail protein n=1 Tax=Ignatzschineria rhizosphaerae TaxID=2923279 RepID=A0ABY3X4T5_9GAMM|nr:hypothetical protein [Ignatzschineria rhizosphaerae]UNM96724.1 hypothetical protein MMG00_02395 [Ignatzschineria rhizosphaerae]
MRKVVASGFETIDGCLYRHQINASLEDVLKLESNRHLAGLPNIVPARTVINVPLDKPVVKETVNLWD